MWGRRARPTTTSTSAISNRKRIQMDEIWSFIYAKKDNVKRAKNAPEEAGDAWTWTAIDADSKLLVSWLVGDRNDR